MITGDLISIAEEFHIEGNVTDIAETGNGHINDTYLVCTDRKKYILQRINTEVFRDPDALMENVVAVTGHIGGRLSYIPARDGGWYVDVPDVSRQNGGGQSGGEADGIVPDGCWRMMTYIDNSYSCEVSDDPALLHEIGRAYGEFISQLEDFPAETLHETIPAFHDTRKRFNDLLRAIDNDPACRKDSAEEEIRFALEHEGDVDVLGGLPASDGVAASGGTAASGGLAASGSPAVLGGLPVRVTHNDTKINNVMLDKDTGRAVCVIDLDTVMPGLAVNDFGDAVRSSASTGREDERDPGNVRLNLDAYRNLAEGFLEGFPDMTPEERRMMPVGAKVMTLECGIRFLTDYLEGDRYFKTDYPEHNLVRCRAQFSLVRDMEEKWEEMLEVAGE